MFQKTRWKTEHSKQINGNVHMAKFSWKLYATPDMRSARDCKSAPNRNHDVCVVLAVAIVILAPLLPYGTCDSVNHRTVVHTYGKQEREIKKVPSCALSPPCASMCLLYYSGGLAGWLAMLSVFHQKYIDRYCGLVLLVRSFFHLVRIRSRAVSRCDCFVKMVKKIPSTTSNPFNEALD